MHQRLIAILFLFLPFVVFSQQKLDKNSVDEKTYKLYVYRDWDRVIEIGKEALKNDIDFDYLRYRMGVAYFSQDKYKKAIHHFRKALDYGIDEETLKEYMYYAYLNSGQPDDAWKFSKKMSKEQREELGIPDKMPITDIKLIYSYSFLKDESISDSEYIESVIDDQNQGFIQLTKSFTTLTTGMKHRIFPYLSLTHNYTYLDKNNYYFTRDFLGKYEDDPKMIQNQYYARMDYTPIDGFRLYMGTHFLWQDYVVYDLNIDNFSAKRTRTDMSSQRRALTFGAKYDFRQFKFGLSYINSDYSDNKQNLYNINITYYPLSNLNFYLHSDLSYLDEQSEGDKNRNEIIPMFSAGYGFLDKYWIEGFYLTGSVKNYTAFEAATIYNSFDFVNNQFGTNLIVTFIESKLTANISYSFTEYKNEFKDFLNQDLDKSIKYSHHSINGGLSWKF